MADFDLPDDDNVIPEDEEDRRKGLGPLQLLNAALRKGAFKKAVEDAQKAETNYRQIEQEMAMKSGHVDKKEIKRILRRGQSKKALADFEESTFEKETIKAQRALFGMKIFFARLNFA